MLAYVIFFCNVGLRQFYELSPEITFVLCRTYAI